MKSSLVGLSLLVMANAKVLYNTLVSKLSLPESADEISAVAFAALQHLGISRTDVLTDHEVNVDSARLDTIVKRLNQQEPLQYIFNEAWFYGRKFFVDNNVLIPRPETELLIDIAKKAFSKEASISVLDIGTGSGCIAITMALEFPKATVMATDVSNPALQVAKTNAQSLQPSLNFIENDIIQGFRSDSKFDLIVSNPPYIAHSEKNTLPNNVWQYEPHLALFGAETDPLIFYRAIAKTAYLILREGGMLAVEINERLGDSVLEIFSADSFFERQIHRDNFGKDRVVTARKGAKNAPWSSQIACFFPVL
jgi:release factor glutamine methyltransferase